jgi:two-component system, NarL family, response regulator DesR
VTALTPRQAAALRLVADGLGCDAIAERLGLSPAAVRTALARARRKLGARSSVHAVVLLLALEREQILTERQTQVLQLAAVGFAACQIGHRLGIGTRVAENHLAAVRRRLGARNTAQAVAIAYREGLLTVERGAA